MLKNCFLLWALLFGVVLFSEGCKSDIPENTIPFVAVYEELNLNDLRYQNLKLSNGYIYLDDLGYRGVVVLSDGSGNYTAFDRACPYHPQEECALVSVHSSGFYLVDDCCGSSFDVNSGLPTGGPAKSPLRPYSAFTSNNHYLIISSQ